MRKSIAITFLLLCLIYFIISSLKIRTFKKNVSSDSNIRLYSPKLPKNLFNIDRHNIHKKFPYILQTPIIINAADLKKLIPNANPISNFANKKYSDVSSLSREDSQPNRIDRIKYYCQKYGLYNKFLTVSRRYSNKIKNRNRYCATKSCPLLVDETNKFLACFVQKVASTSIKKIFTLLSHIKMNNNTQSNVTAFHLNANDQLLRVSPMYYNKVELNNHYYKAIFVRHPFARLVSAFKDKGERQRYSEPYFYAKYWDYIMEKRRGIGNVKNDSRPTFKEFVTLLIETNPYEYDEHWAPYWTRCEPCFVHYDFVGKLETSEIDFKHITDLYKINQIIWENKNNRNKIINKEVKEYLLQISPKDIIELYKIYFLDFKLFGYTIEEIFR